MTRRVALVGILVVLGAVGTAAGGSTVDGTMALVDRPGDTRAGDLDVRKAWVSLKGTRVSWRMVVAQRIGDDVIYSGMFTCGAKFLQLAVKRAAGDTTVFLFDFGASKQVPATGGISGRSVFVAAQMRACRGGRFRFELLAEGTNDRPPQTDRAPNRGRLRFKPGR